MKRKSQIPSNDVLFWVTAVPLFALLIAALIYCAINAGPYRPPCWEKGDGREVGVWTCPDERPHGWERANAQRIRDLAHMKEEK